MIHSISPLLDLSLSRRSSSVSLKFPSDQKAVVERERLRCVIGFIYTNEKWNKKKILAQFLCDIIHYMLLMLDL